MPIYKIADLNILIEPLYEQTMRRLNPYILSEGKIDFEISISKDKILKCLEENGEINEEYVAEGTLILNEICRAVLERYDGFFFHSSALMLDGEAYLFTAKSGTGKSTHARLWIELFGDKAVMINDDKPIIRRADGVFYVYGTPWMGKSNIGRNIKVPIKAVYVLRRSETNGAVRVKTGDVFRQLLEATVVPKNKENMEKLLLLYDGLFSSVDLFLLNCNTDISAAETAYAAANGK